MTIKKNVAPCLHVKKNKHGEPASIAPIRLRVAYMGQRVDLATGYSIEPSKWDDVKHRVNRGCMNRNRQSASEINGALRQYERFIDQIFKEAEVNGDIPSPDDIRGRFKSFLLDESAEFMPEPVKPVRKQIKRRDGREDGAPDIWDVYELFIQENSRLKGWSVASYQKYSTMRNHLLEFKEDISLEDLDAGGLTEYTYFLQTQIKLLNTTVENQVGTLKCFLRWCHEKGYTKQDAYLKFRPRLKTTATKVIFLNDAELGKLIRFTIPDGKLYLERVRDVLLFCCYTGLRYSDAYNLRRGDVHDTYMDVTTVKTADTLVIELNRHSKAILDKYAKAGLPGNRALPVISNQKMNAYLKELCELARIDTPVRRTRYRGNQRIDEVYPKYQLVCTHTGRKTFICRALAKGIPVPVVMKWTGHKDYQAMKPYIDVADETKATAMSMFDADSF